MQLHKKSDKWRGARAWCALLTDSEKSWQVNNVSNYDDLNIVFDLLRASPSSFFFFFFLGLPVGR